MYFAIINYYDLSNSQKHTARGEEFLNMAGQRRNVPRTGLARSQPSTLPNDEIQKK